MTIGIGAVRRTDVVEQIRLAVPADGRFKSGVAAISKSGDAANREQSL